jgi:predicted outer membrane repeat protein
MSFPTQPRTRTRALPARRMISHAFAVFALLIGATIGSVSWAPTAHAVTRWFDGSAQYSDITNCSSIIGGYPYTEKGAAAYTSFAADPEVSQPSPGGVFYVRVVVTILGQNCSGQYADINFQLPAGVNLAISATNPVVCRYNGGAPTPANECPQTLESSAATYGAGYIRVPSISQPSPQVWPIANGKYLAIEVPVVSSGALSGVPFNAKVKMFDGNSSPVLSPSIGVFVFSDTPTIVPKTPNTTFGGTQWPTTLRSESYIYPGSQSGTAYFELSTTPGGTPVQTDPVSIAGGTGGYLVWDDFTPFASATMAANTTYYWRLRFVTAANVTYLGPEQSFTTPPADTATVGTGTPASCTGAALAAAAAAPATTITFDCGSAPVTIQMLSSIALSGDRLVDGGGLVTLQAAANSKHFDIVGRATIQKMTLTGGNTQTCGGSVEVGAPASFWQVRFIGNTTTFNEGGAICVHSGSSAVVSTSVFVGNSATAGGGAIVNAGTLFVSLSTLSGNSALGPGGAILSKLGIVNVTDSSVTENTSGSTVEGGGIAASATNLFVADTTLSGNSAGSGGAISSTAGSLQIQAATIANNTAALAGRAAGVSRNGGPNGSIQSSIVSGNTGPGGNANCASDTTYRALSSTGSNLDSGTTCGFSGSVDLVATDPKLLPLAFWRGTTRTHALAAGSPAIDKGVAPACGTVDQTQYSTPAGNRNVDGDGNGTALCDMGAYEYVPNATAPTVTSIVRTSANPTSAATVQWDVTFSETVLGVDAADFALAAIGVTGVSIASVTPSSPTNKYTVTANTGISGGTLGLNVADNDTILDANNNPLAGVANGSFVGERYDVRPGTATTTTTTTATAPPTTPTTPPTTPTTPTTTTTVAPPVGAALFRAIEPGRLLDSRPGASTIDGQFVGIGVRPAGSITELQITGRLGIPSDATAVVLNVTAVNATAAGFVTVFPCGTTQPTVSNLNLTAGQTVPNAVITKIGASGKICLYTNVATHLLVDVNGYYPNGAAFNAIEPGRLLDSRPGASTIDGQSVGIGVRPAGSITELQITGRLAIPANATAVVLNVTAVAATAAGFVTVFPCGTTQPTVSNLNLTAGQTVPNAVITKIGTGGKICLYTNVATHLLVDINGYYPA